MSIKQLLFVLLLLLSIVCTCEAQTYLYAERDSPNMVAGINVTVIRFFDFYNNSVAEFSFYGANKIQIPVERLDRTVFPSKKAHYYFTTTGLTNTTLTSFPEFAVYEKGKPLDVRIRIKQDEYAMPLVVRFNNSKISDFLGGDVSELKNKIKNLTIVKILEMTDYAYAFNGSGWAEVKFNKTAKRFDLVDNTAGFYIGRNVTETIRINSISLSDFWLNNSLPSGLPGELVSMNPGYYAFIAISVDQHGNPTFKLFAPFIVISKSKPSFSSSTVKGDNLILKYNYNFNASFALLLKKVNYHAKSEIDLRKEVAKSMKVELNYESKELKEVKVFDMDIGLYAPKGMFSYAHESDEDSLALSTAGLEEGEYILYIATFGDNLEPYYFGSAVVSITAPQPTPTPRRPAGGGGYIFGTGIFYTPLEYVKAGESYEIEMPPLAVNDTGIVSITVKPQDTINVRVKIERLKDLPPEIPKPEGMVAAWSISLTLSKETSVSGKIKFRLGMDEIRAKGFDPNAVTIILMKWDGSKWIELPTRFVGSDDKFNYYEAETPAFSYFAAVIKAAPTPTPTTPAPTTPTPTPAPTPAKPPIPGFEAAFAIAGLLALAYLLRRR